MSIYTEHVKGSRSQRKLVNTLQLGGSNEYSHFMFIEEVLSSTQNVCFEQKKKYRIVSYKIVHFTAVKIAIYSLYKKKRKPYVIFDDLSPFEDEHFNLAGYLDWSVSYQ